MLSKILRRRAVRSLSLAGAALMLTAPIAAHAEEEESGGQLSTSRVPTRNSLVSSTHPLSELATAWRLSGREVRAFPNGQSGGGRQGARWE